MSEGPGPELFSPRAQQKYSTATLSQESEGNGLAPVAPVAAGETGDTGDTGGEVPAELLSSEEGGGDSLSVLVLRAKSAILVYWEGLARNREGPGAGGAGGAGAGAGAGAGGAGAGGWTGLKEVGMVWKGEADGDLYGFGVTVVR